MSGNYVKERYKMLQELFIKEFDLTPEEFVDKNIPRLLNKDLRVEMCVTPDHHYTVEKKVILKKGCSLKLAERDEHHRFEPLGYSNYFYVEIINSQIIGFGDLRVEMELFIDAVKL